MQIFKNCGRLVLFHFLFSHEHATETGQLCSKFDDIKFAIDILKFIDLEIIYVYGVLVHIQTFLLPFIKHEEKENDYLNSIFQMYSSCKNENTCCMT